MNEFTANIFYRTIPNLFLFGGGWELDVIVFYIFWRLRITSRIPLLIPESLCEFSIYFFIAFSIFLLLHSWTSLINKLLNFCVPLPCSFLREFFLLYIDVDLGLPPLSESKSFLTDLDYWDCWKLLCLWSGLINVNGESSLVSTCVYFWSSIGKAASRN